MDLARISNGLFECTHILQPMGLNKIGYPTCSKLCSSDSCWFDNQNINKSHEYVVKERANLLKGGNSTTLVAKATSTMTAPTNPLEENGCTQLRHDRASEIFLHWSTGWSVFKRQRNRWRYQKGHVVRLSWYDRSAMGRPPMPSVWYKWWKHSRKKKIPNSFETASITVDLRGKSIWAPKKTVSPRSCWG